MRPVPQLAGLADTDGVPGAHTLGAACDPYADQLEVPPLFFERN